MLLHFVAVPITETIELRRKHSAYKLSWQNPWRKTTRPRRCSPAPAPAILLSVPKASWEIFVKRMRDKPVHHFFQILKFVAQFFRADSDFIILVLKESRISSFFKSHTLFLRKHFVFLPVDELCLISKLPFIVPRGWDDSHERKYHIRSQDFLKLWNHFCYEQNNLKHAIKFLRLLNQINLQYFNRNHPTYFLRTW